MSERKREEKKRETVREKEREEIVREVHMKKGKRADTRNLTSAERLQPIRESFWPAHTEANPELSRTVRGMATKPKREKNDVVKCHA